MKVFLVDKNPLVREFFEEFLKEKSHSVFQYSCAECALKDLNDVSPDIIISGARLGVIDGMEFLKICRNHLKYEGLFFIMTSYPSHSIDSYLCEGANLFLDKNDGYEKILQILNKELARLSTI